MLRSVLSRNFSTRIATRPSDLVGNTPLLALSSSLVPDALKGKIIVKMESMGPCSSVKDRLGLSMINAAELDGTLKPGMTLVEPTSGNTGIALAFIARERGYKLILTMPETMSVERRMMLLALGAEVVLTPKETAVSGAVAKAEEIMEELGERGCMLQQFKNPANPKVHRETTGPEIWADSGENVDVFVSGVGTGGTLTGTSQFFKGYENTPGVKPDMHVVAVEPQEQMLLTDAMGGEKIGEQGPHKIQGMGAGIIPEVIDLSLVDEVVAIHSDKAMEVASRMWLEEGLPVGVSAGAIVAATLDVMSRPEMVGKTAVAIVPSFGERYFTHPMFEEISQKAHSLKKQPLPEPFDNREYGFETERG